jgi:hypothetical protein
LKSKLPQLDVDLTTFLLLGIGEDGVVVLLQTRLHAVEAVELDKARAHELFVILVVSETDVDWVQLGEVLGDGLLRRGVRQVTWQYCQWWAR